MHLGIFILKFVGIGFAQKCVFNSDLLCKFYFNLAPSVPLMAFPCAARCCVLLERARPQSLMGRGAFPTAVGSWNYMSWSSLLPGPTSFFRCHTTGPIANRAIKTNMRAGVALFQGLGVGVEGNEQVWVDDVGHIPGGDSVDVVLCVDYGVGPVREVDHQGVRVAVHVDGLDAGHIGRSPFRRVREPDPCFA